jgi:hypothetical protein
MTAFVCAHRAAGPGCVTMVRRWWHPVRGDKPITACLDRRMKPERLAAATIHAMDPER